MAWQSRTFAALTFLAIAAATASAQFPPLSSYKLLDARADSIPECPCIQDPFGVPEFVPAAYVSGPAGAFETAALSARAKQIVARGHAGDRANLHRTAAAALAGSQNDSFAMAMHLALEELLVDTRNVQMEEQTSRWFHLAAEQGHHDAFVRLAYRYRHGLGVPKDDGAEAYWAHQGAIRGESLAMVAMGLAYATGRWVRQDWSAAVGWWQRAAPTNALATRFIGDAYVCGLGVERSLDLAVQAYAEAARRGEISASIRLGDLYAGDCVAGPEDAAVKAYTVAADEGYPDAQLALSQLLQEGRGTYPDPYTAYRLARLAERRLPDGKLKALAAERAMAAASVLPEFLRMDAEKMVDGMLAAASR